MATITRGARDKIVKKVKVVLDEYEHDYPGSSANVYRQNSVSIRIRIVDQRFARQSKGDRHDHVWNFLSDRLGDDEIQDISVLLLLSPKELKTSFMNAEFDDPVPSTL